MAAIRDGLIISGARRSTDRAGGTDSEALMMPVPCLSQPHNRLARRLAALTSLIPIVQIALIFGFIGPARALPAAPAPTGATPITAPTSAVPASAVGTLEINATPEGVSIYAISVDAQKLFTTLAEKTGLQVIVDDTVKRQITVNLTNLKPEDALNAIVSVSGLSSLKLKDVWLISEGIPSGPSSYLLSDIDSIRTKYVDAAAAKSLLPVFLQDYVKVDADQNSVVLSAPAPVLEKFRGDITRFDVPAIQILFDVLMVEMSDTALDQLNLGLEGTDPNAPAPNLLYNNAGKGFSLVAGLGQLSYQGVQTLPNSFDVRIQALVQKGVAHIRANPQIATVSGRQAQLFIGLQRYISTPVQLPSGNGGQGFSQLNYISAGVNLQITPFTGATGVIFTNLQTEVSVLGADDPTTHLPDKSTRQATTVVTVRDGQTIVLGGLNQDEVHETRTKVPVLGDIPLIGKLFRTHSLEHQLTHLLIFITPHVLSETGHLPANQEEQLKKQYLRPGDEPPPGDSSLGTGR